MKDITKFFYKSGLWRSVINKQTYDLGIRENLALKKFLATIAENVGEDRLDVLHLAAATGREIPLFVQSLPNIERYLLNDICGEVIEKTLRDASQNFPDKIFIAETADIELAGAVSEMRKKLSKRVLFALVANGVIFSNRDMDGFILNAMRKDDLFILTVEQPHPQMADSYLIDPIFTLLSESGIAVSLDNVVTKYDCATQTFKMSCENRTLLASYKPTREQLRERMTDSSFEEVASREYPDLHMLAGLYRKGGSDV